MEKKIKLSRTYLKRILITSFIFCFIIPFVMFLPSQKKQIPLVDPKLEKELTLEQWQKINESIVYILSFRNSSIYTPVMPVIYSSDSEYYLSHNVFKKKDSMGALFLDKTSTEASINLLINGHSSKSKDTQFTFLKNYIESEYFEKYPTFTLIDLKQEHTFLIVSLCEYNLNEESTYTGWYQATFRTQKEIRRMFENTIPYQLQSRPFTYDGQRIVTLVTCNMNKENSRYVIQAIEIT